MKSFGIIFLLTLSTFAFAADEEPSPFQCVEKIVAMYSPSANWKDLSKHIDGHLGFIFGSLKNGKLEEAGPFLNKEKQPEGGFMVTSLTDRKEAEDLFTQDPFVANDVVKVDYKTWKNCKLKN